MRAAGEALQQDHEVFLLAVQQHGCALQFAGKTIQADRVVVPSVAKINEKNKIEMKNENGK